MEAGVAGLGWVEVQSQRCEEEVGARPEKPVKGLVDRDTVTRHHCLPGCLSGTHSLCVYKREWFCDPWS